MSLPGRVALDASFIVDVCKDVEPSKQALGRLRDAGCRLLVPMPVWAEIARGTIHGGIRRIAHIGGAPLAFGTEAAEFLGQALAIQSSECDCGKTAWKYDAMIFACAVCGGCGMLLTENVKHYRPFEAHASSTIKIANAAEVLRIAPVKLDHPTLWDALDQKSGEAGEGSDEDDDSR